MLQPPTASQGDIISLRLIDGTEIVCEFVTLSEIAYLVKNPVKIIVTEEEDVNASVFMAGLGNKSASINKNHVTVFAKTQDTLTNSYLKLIKGEKTDEGNN